MHPNRIIGQGKRKYTDDGRPPDTAAALLKKWRTQRSPTKKMQIPTVLKMESKLEFPIASKMESKPDSKPVEESKPGNSICEFTFHYQLNSCWLDVTLEICITAISAPFAWHRWPPRTWLWLPHAPARRWLPFWWLSSMEEVECRRHKDNVHFHADNKINTTMPVTTL